MPRPLLSPSDENRLLARVTFASSLGDFLSYFAVLIVVRELSDSTLLAAYSVAIKTLAIAFGGVFFPRVASYFGFRSLLVGTQFWSGVLILVLLGAYLWSPPGAEYLILGILFVQTIFRQFFEGARESRSRYLGTKDEQRGLQAQLLQGFYSAQVIGPVLSFFLIRNMDVFWPLVIDACSFFMASYYCLRVGDHREDRKYRAFSVLKYIRQRPALLWIFLIRSVGIWIPIGIFNYVLFSVIDEHYGLDLLNSAWVYAAIGLGSFFSTTYLRRQKGWLSARQDATVAAIGFALLAGTRLAFINLPTFSIALIFLGIGGLCNGSNATVTQSLRRKICSEHELPEVIGLEMFVGRICDWAVSTLLLYLMSHHYMGYEEGVYMSAVSLFVLSFVMLIFRKKFKGL